MHVCLLSAHLFSARQSWQAMWVLTCARCRQMCACLRARAKVSVCVHGCMRVHGRLVRICRWMLTRTPPHNTTGTCSPRRQRRYVFVCRIMRVRVGRSKRVCACTHRHTYSAAVISPRPAVALGRRADAQTDHAGLGCQHTERRGVGRGWLGTSNASRRLCAESPDPCRL